MKRIFCLTAILACLTQPIKAQSMLYPHLFDLGEVTLTEGPFQRAMNLNGDVLMQYDVNRLLTPFVRQAGIDATWEQRYPNFPNWGSGSFRLDGHVGGHYLSALALAYAATGEERFHERMEYMLDVLERCQKAFDTNTQGLYGYIGGYPDNALWTTLYKGDMSVFNRSRGNVPFYVQHKVLAGLRDAYVYGKSERAREMFLKICDWSINVVAKFSDADMQSILDTEHGGMNETLADAYLITKDVKYLNAAKRYSHKTMVNGMQSLSTSFLDSKHANTQVPKYIGFERIAQMDGTSSYRTAAWNFWKDVTQNRTVCIGGNSVDEHFLPTANCDRYITNPNGPESCNTNNMLKLTEDLFADQPKNAALGDFFEKAMFNHILSTQHPTTGGYVYFTALRPQHYRMYSQVNQGMWCCVGTGMENHSKYGEFVYAHQGDTLFVNLFVASELKSDKFGLRQETRFPYDQHSRLTITKAGKFTLAVRRPKWATGKTSTYEFTTREWKAGDVVDIDLPMHLDYETCPNQSGYIALKYGPILLGAKTSTENLTGQFAGEGRMDHAPSLGAQLSLTSAPMLIGNRSTVLDSIYAIDADSLKFGIRPGLLSSERWKDLVLQPFFTIHEARYMTYFQQLTAAEWDEIKDEVEAEEAAQMRLEERTLDFISTGEQQSDAGHARTGTFGTGTYNGEYYIDAQRGNWFQYELETKGVTDSVSLMVRYTGADKGRTCTISLNGETLREVSISGTPTGFYNVEYPIPAQMLRHTDGTPIDTITVRFTASGTTPTPGVYYIRLLRGYEPMKRYSFVPRQWVIGDANRVNSVAYTDEEIQVNGKVGNNNIALQMDLRYSDSTCVNPNQNLFLIRGRQLRLGTGMSYLWWFNGANHASQVAPTYTFHKTGNDNPYYVIWDISKSGLNDYWTANDEDNIVISANGKAFINCFGLTAAANASGIAYINDINFYTAQEAVDRYPELSKTLGVVPTTVGSLPADNRYAAIYDLNGRKLRTTPRGIYIQDGTKHLQ